MYWHQLNQYCALFITISLCYFCSSVSSCLQRAVRFWESAVAEGDDHKLMWESYCFYIHSVSHGMKVISISRCQQHTNIA